ncbi:hypothetical protein SLS58_009054 [Diplodia intermedia]|uniref:Uncharacterized protein n=1 Tax=Diplodia intermedia TaxID=856260 RepID=A0ABR3TEQ8_9PEZI
MHSSTIFASALVGAATAATVPDLTDFSGDIGTFNVTATSGPASGMTWANFTVENAKLDLTATCAWAYDFDGPNPNITLGTQTQVVLYVTECDTPDFALYWGNTSQSLQIAYTTTLTGRPVTIQASDGLIPDQDCSGSTCSAAGTIGINSVALLDSTGSTDPAGQYGYWDVTYSNFTSAVQAGYATEDLTFQYSGGGSVNCFQTVAEAGAAPGRFCTGDLDVDWDTAVVPERSLSLNSTVVLNGTNTTLVGAAPIRGVCYIKPGGLVCEDRLRVQVSEATA